jgi:hypothetical protein
MRLWITFLALFAVNAHAETVFVGKVKNTEIPCSLRIVHTYYLNQIETPENFRADVVAEIEDDHKENHGTEIVLTVAPLKAGVMSGVGANGKDQMNVFVPNDASDLSAPTAYAVKWWHINHYHGAQCLGLTPSI